MASIIRHGNAWRAHVYVNGNRKTKVFEKRKTAEGWAERQEQQLRKESPEIRILALDELRTLPDVARNSIVSGVYFLWDAAGQLAYIGQSRNIMKRVARHIFEPPVAFQTATFMSVPFPWQLTVEQLYIAKYGQSGQRAGDFSSRIESYVPRYNPRKKNYRGKFDYENWNAPVAVEESSAG